MTDFIQLVEVFVKFTQVFVKFTQSLTILLDHQPCSFYAAADLN